MIVAHKNAVLALLRGDSLLAGCGYEGTVHFDQPGQRPKKYWTIYTDSGLRGSDRLDGLPRAATLRYTVHCIGQTPEQAQGLADRVITRLAGAQLAVEGFAPFRMQHTGSDATQMDTTNRPPLHYTVDRFDLRTQPA